MNTPLFSIVIANYNYGRFLSDAIESVLAQGMDGDIELIIMDGGSTDNSVDVIKKYAAGLPPGVERSDPSILRLHLKPSPITYWISAPDKGQSDAFNKGFAHAKGRFLTWLNADDVFMPGALQAIAYEIRRHLDCEWFVGSSVWADETLKITKCFCAHRFSYLRARWGFLSAAGPSSFFTKRLLDAVGGIDEQMHFVMDTDLWYKFYFHQHAGYRCTCHPVWCFRIHENSKMSGGDVATTDATRERRKRADVESALIGDRYGRRGGVTYKLAHLLSFSPWDWWKTRRFTKRLTGTRPWS